MTRTLPRPSGRWGFDRTAKVIVFGTAALFIAALALLIASPAVAGQPQCDKRDKLVEFLASQFQERSAGDGIEKSGKLVEIFTSPDGGTWTLLVTDPNGLTCAIAAGEGWRMKEQIAEGPEA